MVRTVWRTALLVAALLAVPFALSAVHAGGAHAQAPGVCLTDPASDTVTCVDASGNPVDQFAAPIGALSSAPAAATTAQAGESCYIDETGTLICPAPIVVAPLVQPSDTSAQQPVSQETESELPQVQPTAPEVPSPAGQNCAITDAGGVSCM